MGVWVWAVTTYVVARWAWRVLPVSGGGRAEVGLPNGRKVVMRKEEGERAHADVEEKKVEN